MLRLICLATSLKHLKHAKRCLLSSIALEDDIANPQLSCNAIYRMTCGIYQFSNFVWGYPIQLVYFLTRNRHFSMNHGAVTNGHDALHMINVRCQFISQLFGLSVVPFRRK